MNLATFAATMAIGALAWAGGPSTAPTASTVPAKKAATRTAARKTPAVSTANSAVARKPVSGTATAAAKRTGKKAPIVHTSWRTRQIAPTADRYREIQEALVARGYLSAEDVTGAWGPSSTNALKKFQAEQTLDSTGKIDSLSLIALGLGPRHDSAFALPRAVDANVQSELGRN